jgi:hypothetical protein
LSREKSKSFGITNFNPKMFINYIDGYDFDIIFNRKLDQFKKNEDMKYYSIF